MTAPNLGERLDAIIRDLDATTKAWAEAGYGYGTPEEAAREAVFARLREWNDEVSHRHGTSRPAPVNAEQRARAALYEHPGEADRG